MQLDLNKNYIIQGDNLEWLNWIPDNSIDLCYIDPPFFTNKDYGEFKDKFKDIKEYIDWMRSRIELIHKKLKQTGSIFLHCDWHASHRLRCLLDYVFGAKNFVNEIVWSFRTGGNTIKYMSRKHQNIFWYSKTKGSHRYNLKKEKNYIADTMAEPETNTGRRLGINRDHNCEFCGNDPGGKYKIVNLRDVWEIEFSTVAVERIGYPTQKPEALIKRIVECASNPGDVILDCFSGGGTTAKVCADLNRKFIVGDVSSKAIEITNKRLDEKCSNVTYEIKGLPYTDE